MSAFILLFPKVIFPKKYYIYVIKYYLWSGDNMYLVFNIWKPFWPSSLISITCPHHFLLNNWRFEDELIFTIILFLHQFLCLQNKFLRKLFISFFYFELLFELVESTTISAGITSLFSIFMIWPTLSFSQVLYSIKPFLFNTLTIF